EFMSSAPFSNPAKQSGPKPLDSMKPNPNQSAALVKYRFLHRGFQFAFLLAALALGCPLLIPPALASTSGNLRTVNVTNVGPAAVFAGAQKVAIYSFTIQVKTNGVNDTLKDIRIQYAGDSTADLSNVYLYRESGSIPGTFNAAQDTLLASDTTAPAGEFDLNPADFGVTVGTSLQ